MSPLTRHLKRLSNFALALFSVSFTAMVALAEPGLPVVTDAQLNVGASWTWQYFEDDRLYSTERYTVIMRDTGGYVWLELSSVFPGQNEFHATHRLRVKVESCLKAHAATVGLQPWSFDMLTWTGATWEKIEAPSTLAFEEKFNCNPHVYAPGTFDFVTRFKTDENGALFSQERWGRLNSSWFLATGPSAGIAVEKQFPKPIGQPTYTFRLVR
jgi:hypothetical protein